MRGNQAVQPMAVLHSLRTHPSPGYTARGQRIPPDYIVTDKPIGKCYTGEVTKRVSRPEHLRGGAPRVMRPKTSKVKFLLLDPDEVDSEIRRSAHDLNWGPNLFDDGDRDVVPTGAEEARAATLSTISGTA